MLTPIVFADRVKDTSTTTGTGNFTLSGSAPSGFQAFDAALGHAGNYFYYVIDGGAEWEVGIGHLSASTTLVRDSILASSNSGSAVSFSAGTKNVFCDLAAAGIPQISVLSSDATYNNTTTFANTNLSLSVVAGGVYKVEVNLPWVSNGAAPKFDFNGGSATATFLHCGWRRTGAASAPSSSGSEGSGIFTGLSDLIDSNWGGSGIGIITLQGILVVNAAGTLIVRAAQRTVSATDTLIKQGSHMVLTRIG